MTKVTSMKVVVFMILTVALTYGTEFAISTGSGSQRHSDVVFDGTRYTVVYDSVGDIWYARISTGGSVTKYRLTNTADIDSTPSIATDGTYYFIVWVRSNLLQIYRAVIDANGNFIANPAVVPFGTAKWNPVVSYCNGYYLVVANSGFIMLPGGWMGKVEGVRYDANGIIQGTWFTIDATSSSNPDDEGNIGHPAVGADGTRFMVTYSYSTYQAPYLVTDIVLKYKFVTTGGIVQPGGTICGIVLTGESLHDDTLQRYPSDIAYNGSKYFVSYHFFENNHAYDGGYYDVYGAIIATDGVINYNFSIAAVADCNECASAVTTEDGFFFIVWQDHRLHDYNLYGRHCSSTGTLRGAEVSVATSSYSDQSIPQIAFDGHNNLVTWSDYRNSNWDIYANFFPKWLTTTDGSALAYNGNRHLVRKPNSNEFHMVYTDRGRVVHRYSRNDSMDQATLDLVGDGKWPSLVLDADGWPHIAWTDNSGGLWFRYQDADGWSTTYHLFTPSGSDPIINSPPSIALVVNRGVIYPHILVTRNGPSGDVAHRVDDFSFSINDPGAGSFELLEQRTSLPASPPLRLNPSLVEDDYDSLHATWQRTDTIAYATRYRTGGSWSIWSPPFGSDGRQSAYSFAETYGDKVYVVWQKGSPAEIWLARRSISSNWSSQDRWNKSNTSSESSVYGTTAFGAFTVFADETDSPWDVYYVTDQMYNISSSSGVTSQYPHSVAKLGATSYLYTLWLEDNSSPYEMKFKKITYIPNDEQAYLSSNNGQSTGSRYLISRDGFKDTWQVPIDYGNTSLTYRFQLLPGFKYKIRATAFHQNTGEWKEKVKVDNQVEYLINYTANTPKTIEVWIPEVLYQDSMIEVVINNVSGSFATAGPIDIYRYEYEEGENGGPQSAGTLSLNDGNLLLHVNPNPARKEFSITYTIPNETRVSLSLYDASGRLVTVLVDEIQAAGSYCKTPNSTHLAQGVYFLKLNTSSHTETNKVIYLK